MFRTVIVPHGHRAFVRVDGRAVRYLGAGRHRVFALRRLDVETHDTAKLFARLSPDALALVPPAELARIHVEPHERALVVHAGRPKAWLAPHEHFTWTAAGPVEVELVDTSALEAPPLPDPIRAVVPSSDYVEVTVPDGTVALRYVDGVIESELGPGRHAAWTTMRRVAYAVAARVGTMHVLLGSITPFAGPAAEGSA